MAGVLVKATEPGGLGLLEGHLCHHATSSLCVPAQPLTTLNCHLLSYGMGTRTTQDAVRLKRVNTQLGRHVVSAVWMATAMIPHSAFPKGITTPDPLQRKTITPFIQHFPCVRHTHTQPAVQTPKPSQRGRDDLHSHFAEWKTEVQTG